jgi:hypothetical protein
MNNTELKSFATLITGLADYYRVQISDAVIRLYWEGLKGYDYKAIESAAIAHMQNPDTGQFMPKIADIKRMMEGTTQDSALLAWSKVDKAIRQIGTYQDVVFDDPIIHRVIADMGGWIKLGDKSEDEWPFVAKEFENRYRGFKSRNEKIEYPQKMIGIANASNQHEGFKQFPPIMIGNTEKAKLVLGDNEIGKLTASK